MRGTYMRAVLPSTFAKWLCNTTGVDRAQLIDGAGGAPIRLFT